MRSIHEAPGGVPEDGDGLRSRPAPCGAGQKWDCHPVWSAWRSSPRSTGAQACVEVKAATSQPVSGFLESAADNGGPAQGAVAASA
jgi:hypothetical protein